MKSLRMIMIAIGFALLSGCSTPRKTPSASPVLSTSERPPSQQTQLPQMPKLGEAMGPPEPYGPDPIRIRPVVLVLGPGLARGFAYVGVIRALSEAGIPIGAILGTEMGGFIGALFANTGKVNQLEWSLMKFKTELFLEQEGFLSAQDQVPSNGKAFFQQLTQIFGAKDLKDLKVPIQIAFQDNDTGQVLMVAQGNVAHAVRATMAATPLFTPSQWAVGPNSWVSVSSAGKTRPFLVQEGQAMGIGPVIAIDVLTDTEEQAAWDFVKGADLVIKPNMTGIGKLDFQKKTDAAFRGKKAVIQQISKIRHLVGLSDVDSRTSHTQKGSSL